MRKLSERLRKKQRQAAPLVVGVSWYNEAEWAHVKAASADPECFEPSFVEWSAMAEQALVELKQRGVKPVKVFVVAQELLAWCLVHNKPNDAGARAEFVSEKVRAQHDART
jgi:hypothetical protein